MIPALSLSFLWQHCGPKASHHSEPEGALENAGQFFFLRYKSVFSFYITVVFSAARSSN